MTYIDAFLEREKNIILVSERDSKGNRLLVQHPTRYVVYWPSERGKYTSIHGTRLDRYQTSKIKEFQRELGLLPKDKLHESDINPIFRCLYDNYKDATIPNLHVGFLDIEVDFDPERGYSSVDDAFAPITAISLYLNWLDRNFTLVIKPKSMSTAAAQTIVERFEDTMLCENEKELLDIFLTLIDDCDVLTGWNSESFDIPYIHNRIVQVLGKDETRRLCLWNKLPKKREYESYGRQQITYDLVGRVHLDYLQLYRKHTYHEMHSYRLDFVGEYEVNEKKIHYEGTLDQLYNNDFYKFIEYSRQDVMLLVKIDTKLKLIDLSNNLAHTNCVLFQTTMGAVGLIDQAIVNAAHDLDLIVPNRKRYSADDRDLDGDGMDLGSSVVGAYVADPKPGMHDWIGGVDINSLYPSVIRALNMSPETVVGQLRPEMTDKLITKRIREERRSFADAWNNMFGSLEYTAVMEQQLIPITVDFEDGSEVTVTAQEVYDLVFNSGKRLMISANGTIFSYDKPGVIPGVLARWYKERQELQAEYRKYNKLADAETDPATKKELKAKAEFYDQRQLIRKIGLNSLYGAIGNPGSRWFDPRVAQSTTLSGRCVVRHMQGKINEIITGNYDHVGESIIYGDTDSVDAASIIQTSIGKKTIEELFLAGNTFWNEGDKEYSRNDSVQVIGFDQTDRCARQMSYLYVYRHRVSKSKHQITTESGKSVTVTSDHSLIVLEDGRLVEKKPQDVKIGDQMISLGSDHRHYIEMVVAVDDTGIFSDEYVYDIGISEENPFFFANDLLVHNSGYFSAYPVMKDQEEFRDFEWSKENVTDLYDKIGDIANESFPDFMTRAFNCPIENGSIIKASRELCALKGLFITKKRYAVLIYDKEGKRMDQGGKPGSIKAMGLDLKRSDTPKSVQDFLNDVLVGVLTGKDRSAVVQQIADFRKTFRSWDKWLQGSPKRANNITNYENRRIAQEKVNFKPVAETKKVSTPGHVTASLNWNSMRRLHNDHYSMPIADGAKVVVCKLKPNPLGLTSIAYPVDELKLPTWFKELPFDTDAMEEALIDKKLENLLSVLNWAELKEKHDSTFGDLFSL